MLTKEPMVEQVTEKVRPSLNYSSIVLCANCEYPFKTKNEMNTHKEKHKVENT